MTSRIQRRIDANTVTRTFAATSSAIATVLIGVACSIALSLWLASRDRDLHRDTFARLARTLSVQVQRGFELPLEAVRTLPEFFAASEHVSRDEFRAFVEPILRRHPTVSYIEWAPYVTDQERPAFEQRARETGWPKFQIVAPAPDGIIRPSPQRSYYLPLIHAVSLDTVQPLIGLDVGFSDDRRARNDHALRYNSIDISPRFSLVEDPPEVGSIAILVPFQGPRHVHPSHAPPPDPTVPRRGLAILIFRLEPTILRALAPIGLADLELVILDETATTNTERVLFESSPGLATRTPSRDGDHVWEQRFDYHSRAWNMRFIAPRATLLDHWNWGGFAVGLIASLAIGYAVALWSAVRRLRSQVQIAHQLGQYRITRRLGQGGMGVVYAAEHALLRRPTAVKVLSDKTMDPQALERFEREVQITSALTHPNTISVFDYGRTEDDIFYYAMEYIDGTTIERLVRDCGPLPPARVIHLLTQVCGSLSEAHASGLVHRDIKPSNIMVCDRGGVSDFVKVLDFGLVKQASGMSLGKLSLGDQLLGTPQYMAPEALLPRGEVTASADTYALGCVAYYMLTASEVFPAESVASVVAQHLHETPQLPSLRLGRSLPADLETLVMRCLAKQPAERPASMADLSEALQACAIDDRWTPDDAREFWTRYRAQPSAEAEQPAPDSAPETLTVDLGDRPGTDRRSA